MPGFQTVFCFQVFPPKNSMFARSLAYLILLDSIMVIVNDNYFKSLYFVISSFYFMFYASLTGLFVALFNISYMIFLR